ncbi:MAG: hypothetical protein CL908_26115 [Deltaproteobacteria bacterium]|nr:hypothetical protein [Deltaproteobacteria bacterium]
MIFTNRHRSNWPIESQWCARRSARARSHLRGLSNAASILVLVCVCLPSSRGVAQSGDDVDDPFAGVEEMAVYGGAGIEGLLTNDANSVTAFDSTQLDAIGANTIEDLADFTPNLEIVSAGATSPTFFIRGIGLNDFAPTSGGAITVVRDDVIANAKPLQLGALFDIDSVATLRGPQGTGPYRNASGGAIKIYSKKPTGEFNSFLEVGTGNYGLFETSGAIEAPVLPDLLAARFSFKYQDRGGYLKNLCAGAPAIADRVARPSGVSQPTDPRWSHCGESVSPGEISDVPTGLPRRINDIENWAVRGMLLLTPDWLDSEWLAKVHASRVENDSQLGQMFGTEGVRTRPENGEPVVYGGLSGVDGDGYIDANARDTRDALVRQLLDACMGCSRAERVEQVILGRSVAAREFARELDSNPWEGAYNRVGKTSNDIIGGMLKGTLEFDNGTELVFISGVDHYDLLLDRDLDFSPNRFFQFVDDIEGIQITEDIRLTGALDDDELTTWELGGLFLYEELDVTRQQDFGEGELFQVASRDYVQTTYSGNAYLELSTELTETFTLDGGARINVERKQIDYRLERIANEAVANEDVSWTAPTGTARLTFRPTEDISFFGKYTRGWKSGNFNATGNLNQGVLLADPETIDAYEIGFRAHLIEDQLTLSSQLFFYDYDDYQLFTSNNNFGALPEFLILNASSVQVIGAEVESELNMELTSWLDLFGAVRFGWLQSRFLDFTQRQLQQGQLNGEAFIAVTEIDNSGNRLLNSPQFTVSITIEPTFDLGGMGFLKLRYDGNWKDDTFFDATEGRGIPNEDGDLILPQFSIGQKAYWLHNFRVSYANADETFELAGWIKNATNQAYKTFSFDASTFQSTTVHFVGEPRFYGLSTTFRF